MQVTLGKKEATLTKPTSFAEAWDVASLGERNPHRAFAAALGLCGIGRKLKIAYTGDPMAYGGKVIDALHAQGLSMADIMGPAAIAFSLCAEMVITAKEVDEAETFTEAPEEGLTL